MILEALKSGALIGFKISGAAIVVCACALLVLMLFGALGNTLSGKDKSKKGE
jgi:hypothetical protein